MARLGTNDPDSDIGSMPMLNRLQIHGDQVAALLRPDEVPYALQAATHVPGAEDLGQQPPALGGELLDIALGWHSEYLQGLTDGLVGGTNLIGWLGCEAQILARAAAGHDDLVVTDQRLLLITFTADPPRILWEREHRGITLIRRAPRFAQAGRIQVVMADGSAVALMLGVFSAAGARRVVDGFAAASQGTSS